VNSSANSLTNSLANNLANCIIGIGADKYIFNERSSALASFY
jgi:hypothetical protein